ncbi:metallophosphoesterase [Chloroherpeton thalassium ATCC 35110]|uniref:Metallophosphoesterase n=2 Tax=Chloroherpeton thalassium TaxID=100716 RepID=B3QWR9_CHLT3|nr:metallophosphoesterase [Chloroherpeton thalassium ATCC 35110]
MSKTVNVFFMADIVGQPGVDIVTKMLKGYIQKYQIHFVICNGENAYRGKGMSNEILKQLRGVGVDVITGGNHIWDNYKFHDTLKKDPAILRPMNYPKGTYGTGYGIFDLPNGLGKIGVLNLQGRTFMYAIDCPFRTADWVIEKMSQETKYIIVDIHAEATAEKIALAMHLDGRASAVMGSHSHVQTSDERILKNGTGYCTDVGMTGPYDSVIGMVAKPAIERFVYQTPRKYECATDDVHLCAMVIKLDAETGKTVFLERIFFPEFEKSTMG